MKISINERNEITSFAIVGDIENSIFVDWYEDIEGYVEEQELDETYLIPSNLKQLRPVPDDLCTNYSYIDGDIVYRPRAPVIEPDTTVSESEIMLAEFIIDVETRLKELEER